MHLAAKNDVRHGAADQRGGDVVEKRRQHEHDDQQRETAFPLARQVSGQFTGNLRLFEVFGQKCKTHQKTEQVRQNHPLVLEVQNQSAEAVPALNPVKTSL